MKTGLKNAIMNAHAPMGAMIIMKRPSALGRNTRYIEPYAANTIQASAYQCTPHQRSTTRKIFIAPRI
jgi:hypothetical protein